MAEFAHRQVMPVARHRTVSGLVNAALQHGGHALPATLRASFGSAFGYDFSHVRVHADEAATESAAQLGAAAYSVGSHVVLGSGHAGRMDRDTSRLLAHELTHVIQQDGGRPPAGQHIDVSSDEAAEAEAVRAAATFESGGRAIPVQRGIRVQSLHAQLAQPYAGRVRSPAVEEFLTQETEFFTAAQGKPLIPLEIDLARSVFGESIDYSRVRLLETAEPLWFRTVANVIRVPPFFTVDPNAPVRHRPLTVDYMRETFIHELTHVWQYQHGGTSYISYSLGPQLQALISSGDRNAAYCYDPDPTKSFWDFTPEQQGMIAENTFVMRASGWAWRCDSQGRFRPERRPAEIARLLPIHERYVAQMRAALPAPEADIRTQRAGETIGVAGGQVPTERQLTPIKPLLEIRF
jgi:hypothetical protein